MDDRQIVQLYWERNETAIDESQRQYGGMLTGIAYSILQNREDSEECVSDTYYRAWESIPPQKPVCLSAYLGRITRNLSLNRLKAGQAQKRGTSVPLSELTDCLPSSRTVETEINSQWLTQTITGWLRSLPPADRALFLRRYWFGDSLAALADASHTTPNKLAGRLFRLRRKLKVILEQEAY